MLDKNNNIKIQTVLSSLLVQKHLKQDKDKLYVVHKKSIPALSKEERKIKY